MTTTRNILAFTVVVLAVTGSAFVLSWMEQLRPKYPIDYGAMLWEGISITDVQFGPDCMYIIVKNLPPEYCTVTVKINNATISNANHNTSVTIPLNETIPVDSQRSIRIGYEWTYGSIYDLVLISTRGNVFRFTAVAPAYTNPVKVI